jgi:hypothetical protein
MEKITIREGWVDNLNDIDMEILMGELNFPKIYAKERVKGEGHHASPSALITRVEHALSCSS